MRRSLGVAVVIGGGWLAACASAAGTSTPEGADAGASFGPGPPAVDPYDVDAAVPLRVRALFARCGGGPESTCHGAGAGGLRLRLGADGDVVDVRSLERPDMLRVRRFDPGGSYLYLKVVGDGGIEGGRMPPDGVDDPRTRSLVASWIEAGAP